MAWPMYRSRSDFIAPRYVATGGHVWDNEEQQFVTTCLCDLDPTVLCPVHGTTYKGMQPEDILHKEQ